MILIGVCHVRGGKLTEIVTIVDKMCLFRMDPADIVVGVCHQCEEIRRLKLSLQLEKLERISCGRCLSRARR